MCQDHMRILAVGAHPDDLEILCGGTLARYAALGHTVIMAHLLNGDKGHYRMDSEELARIRKQEAIDAARVIGAEAIALDVPDGQLFNDLQTRQSVMDLIRQTRPDVIITHAPQDYMADHTTTGELVRDAGFYSASPLFKTQHDAHNKIPPVLFMDTVMGMGFQPTEYVDISETFPQKKEMIRCHASQLQWLKEHDNIDIVQVIEKVAAFRGLQCGAQYAEGFCQYDVWPRKVPRRVLP